jgi:hypothetical protein
MRRFLTGLLLLILTVIGCSKSYERMADKIHVKTEQAAEAVKNKALGNLLSQTEELEKSEWIAMNITGISAENKIEIKKIVDDLFKKFSAADVLAMVKNEKFTRANAQNLKDSISQVGKLSWGFARFGAIEIHPSNSIKGTKIAEDPLFEKTFYSKEALLDGLITFVNSNTGG